MKLSKETKICIIGLGLLGGSYAMALKKQGYSVTGIVNQPKTLAYALSHDMIDKGAAEVDAEIIGNADLLIFALYPQVFLDWVAQYKDLLKSGAVLTDVTGVKGFVVDKIQAMLPYDVEFIAAHPMAGREVCGIENSTDEIFKGANYLVVPTERNTPEAIALCKELGRVLGFKRIAELTVKQHDEMIAFLSQLTHCIAVSLMCCNDTPGMEAYTGDSFRDLTRIARINDEMWSELFLDNKEALLREMERFQKEFQKLFERIKADDRQGIRAMMRCSTERRGKFDKVVEKE